MTAADMAAADVAAADVAALRQPGATHDAQACAEAWAALTAAHALVTEQLSAALTRTCGLSINEFQILLVRGETVEQQLADRLGVHRAAQGEHVAAGRR